MPNAKDHLAWFSDKNGWWGHVACTIFAKAYTRCSAVWLR